MVAGFPPQWLCPLRPAGRWWPHPDQHHPRLGPDALLDRKAQPLPAVSPCHEVGALTCGLDWTRGRPACRNVNSESPSWDPGCTAPRSAIPSAPKCPRVLKGPRSASAAGFITGHEITKVFAMTSSAARGEEDPAALLWSLPRIAGGVPQLSFTSSCRGEPYVLTYSTYVEVSSHLQMLVIRNSNTVET